MRQNEKLIDNKNKIGEENVHKKTSIQKYENEITNEINLRIKQKIKLFKYLSIWKEMNMKLKERQKIENAEPLQKKIEPINTNKKPFVFKINKISIKKRILEFPKNKIKKVNQKNEHNAMPLNKYSLISQFFLKWKNNNTKEKNSNEKIINRQIIKNLINKLKSKEIAKKDDEIAYNNKKSVK